MRTSSCIVQLAFLLLVLFAVTMTVHRLFLNGNGTATPAPAETAAPPEPDPTPEATLDHDEIEIVTPNIPARAGDDDADGDQDIAEAPESDRDENEGADDLPHVEGLRFSMSRSLSGILGQVRGLAVDDRYLYVTLFNPVQGRGFLMQSLREGPDTPHLREMGPEGYIPGGPHLGADYLWVPLMPLSDQGGSRIAALDRETLQEMSAFETEGRIRAVVEATPGRLFGISEDSDRFYEWDSTGREIRRVPNASGGRYHDLEWVQGSLVCAGLDATGGLLDVIDPQSMTLLVRYRCNVRLGRDRWLTDGGFGVYDDTFYFMTEGTDSSLVLMTYLPAEGSIRELVPSVAD